MLIIEMDGNSWLGGNVIPGDPNITTNSNGKLFLNFLNRNKDISLVNALSLCEGVITRQRKTELLNEMSVLDVFLVCKQVLPFVQKMTIDSNRENPLTNFHGLRITESDHNKMELILNIQVPVIRQRREEMFNFRNADGQYLFHNLTNNSPKLRNSFKLGRIF